MIINHNLAAMNTYNQYSTNNNKMSSSLQKLSSGLRINSAADDAAGLAISEKMRGQIRGLDQASSNAQDGISMIQTAEGALSETESILQRMRELATQASNDTNTGNDRNEIQKEMNQLTSEINRIGNTTEFNTQKLLNGTGGEVTAGTNIPASEAEVTGSAITLGTGTDFSTTNLKFDVKIGSATKSVTLSKDYDGTTNSIDTLVSDLQAVLGSDVTVAKDSGALKITAANTTDAITISAATSGNLSSIGLTTGTTNPISASTTSAKSSFTLQIGANTGQNFTISINDMRADALDVSSATKSDTKTVTVDGVNYTAKYTATQNVTNGTDDANVEYALDVSDADSATAAIQVIDDAINTVSAERSNLGAYQNRLEHTINNLSTSSENMTSAESRIRDVDMAKEMMNYQKTSVLQQAAQAMLAQANQQPQGVLKLLQ